MRCLICNENFDVEILKNHNQYHHSVNKNNYFFKELFLPDDIRQNCDMCYIHFKNCRQRINHNFLFYRNQQIGVRLNQSHPRNVLRGGPIIYYWIKFYQHKNVYGFYDDSIVDSFFYSVQHVFIPTGCEFKIQGYFKIKNYQKTEIAKIENTRVWLTNVYIGKYFNRFVRVRLQTVQIWVFGSLVQQINSL